MRVNRCYYCFWESERYITDSQYLKELDSPGQTVNKETVDSLVKKLMTSEGQIME